MATVKSSLKNVKGSVQKVKIPAEIVKGMDVNYALDVLQYMPKRAAKHIWKVVNTAKADAVHNFGLNESDLYIEEIQVNKGKGFKRFKPGSRGSVKPIFRHMSHVTVVVSDSRKAKTEVTKKEVKKNSVEPKKVESKEVKSKKTSSKKVEAKKSTVKKTK